MEKSTGTPLKELNESSPTLNQPQQCHILESSDTCKSKFTSNSTPEKLKVPKAFKFPERYRSPTDHMMSPVSKGLLARNRKAALLLPPSIIHPKIKELQTSDSDNMVPLQTEYMLK